MRARAYPRLRAAAALVGSLLLAVAGVAHASRIHYRDVSLAEAVEGARVIVVARYEGYESSALRFRVSRTLEGGEAPESIEVTPHELRIMRSLARQHRRSGIRRSPLIDRLEGHAELEEGQDYCVLLGPRSSRNRYRLHIASSVVRAPCPRVEELLSDAGATDRRR